MRRSARAWLVAASFACLPAAADPRDDAARLAILGERAGKLHAQAIEGVAPERSRRALQSTVRDFETTLREAVAHAPASMREHYALLGLLWREYRLWIARPATRDAARAQVDRDDELEHLTTKGMGLAGPLPPPREKLARAARDSQRVVRIALLRRDVSTDVLAAAEAESLASLREGLAALEQETASDAGLVAEVQVAQNQLPFLVQALEIPAPRDVRTLDLAARSADHILEAIERGLARGPTPP